MAIESNLERTLNEGKFAVTCEIGPKRGVDTSHLREMAELVKPYCDAFNITDNQTAVVRMSSIATGIFIKQMDMDPVIQIVTRDRNRLAIQSDMLGAAAHGIMNVLALSGDHQTMGNHPGAKNVYDIDSMQLIQCLVGLREGRFMNGEELETEPPHLFVGAAANPFGHPREFRVARLGKKVKAGAQFIQTQPIFALDIFKRFMDEVRNCGLHERVHIMAGIIPMKSMTMAKYMQNKVAGVIVPEETVLRLECAVEGLQDKKERIARVREEGIQIAAEEIQQAMEIPGVHGVHIMAVAWEEVIPELLKRAGLVGESPRYRD